MRKLYPLIFLLFSIITFSHAQNPTPNYSFEYWRDTTVVNEFAVPQDWDNLNTETGVVGVLTCLQTTNAYLGAYAVELVTKLVFGDTANGIITTGHLITSPPYGVNGGIPFNLRPDSMYGWYEYFPAPGDSTDIQFGVYDDKGNTIGLASFITGDTMKTYKRFSVPIIYSSDSTPDTSRWLISSSNGYKSIPGSTLYIDDIGLIGAGAGIATPDLKPVSISIMPNPSSGFIIVSNPKTIQGTFALFNDIGGEVKQFQLTSQKQNIDIHDLAEGDYLYSVKDNNSNDIVNGTIIVK